MLILLTEKTSGLKQNRHRPRRLREHGIVVQKERGGRDNTGGCVGPQCGCERLVVPQVLHHHVAEP